MTTISKQAKISARKLIRDNFWFCFITAFIFSLPMVIFLLIPFETSSGMTYIIQGACAPLVLLGCKAYYLKSIGEKISPYSVFSSYQEQNLIKLGYSIVWRSVLILLKYLILPMVLFVGVIICISYLPVTQSVSELYFDIFAFFIFAPFIVLSYAETFCIYMASIACMFEGKDKSYLKEYTAFFKQQKWKITLFTIGPLALSATLLFISCFVAYASIAVTFPLGMMYLVACYTFYAKYTIDERNQNNFDDNYTPLHTDEKKYAGVDKDLL